MPPSPSRTASPSASSRFRFPGDAARRGTIPQLPGIDGMRGAAVLLVIAYHLGMSALPGGFLGVEVFFVVSGYLITSLLLAELRDKSFLDLAGFWGRRVRRLLPALFVLLGTLALLVPFVASDASARVRSDLPGSIFYVANWWQIFGHHSYFESFGRPPLLQHLWSLAIEEQFYLLWPPVLAALYTRTRRRLWVVGTVTSVAAGWSVLAMFHVFDPSKDPSRAYYGTDTRVSALLIGATLACLWNPDVARRAVNPPPRLVDLAGGVGAFVVALAAMRYNGFDPGVYRGGFLVVSLGTATVLVAATTPGTWSSRLLGTGSLRAIGARSYGLYLWHWPIIQLTRPGIDVPLHGLSLLVVRGALIAGAAEASWRLVERPLRRPQTTARGPLAIRYRRAELAVAFALPLLLVPFLFARSANTEIIDTAAPSVPAGLAQLAPVEEAPVSHAAGTTATTVTTTPQPSSPTAPAPDAVTTTTAPPTAPAPSPPPAAPPTPSLPGMQILGMTAARGEDMLFVGDSVMLGAQRALLAHFPGADVDAVVGRQLRDGATVLRSLRAAGRFRSTVVVHLGTNGSATPGQIDELMATLAEARLVVVVNTNAPREWRDAVNDRLAALPAQYPNVRLADWRAVTQQDAGLLGPDGVHVNATGAERYAALIESVTR